MTWFKVDDGLPDHPKMVALQTHRGWQGALALWTLAGAWVSKHLQDGFVPEAMVVRLGCAKKDAQLLSATGFWETVPGGYRFHDWHSRNPSRQTVEERRDKTRQRVSEWREKKSGNESCNGVTGDVANDTCNPSPVPSRPVPSERESALGVDPPADFASPSTASLVRQFHAELLGEIGTFPSQSSTTAKSYAAIARWAEAAPDPTAALQALFVGFREDAWAKGASYPVADLANRSDKYHVAGRKALEEGAAA